MKPYKSFLFLLILLLICSALSYSHRQREAAIAEAQRIARERAEREQFVQDSIEAVERRFFLFDTALFFRAELAAVPSRPFEYDTALSEHPLAPLYNLLRYREDPQRFAAALMDFTNEWDDEPEPLIRILHYGDSQIENDRISGSFRRYMQRAFGGAGRGLVSLSQSTQAHGLKMQKSKEWVEVSLLQEKRRGNYGLSGGYLMPPAIWFIQPQLRTADYGHFKLDWRQPEGGAFVDVFVHEDVPAKNLSWMVETRGEEETEASTAKSKTNAYRKAVGHQASALPTEKTGFGIKRLRFPREAYEKSRDLNMRLGRNHHLYALSFNDSTGICVDNLPYRGNSGYIFSPQQRAFLSESYRLSDVKLIIYQFGANLIPYNTTPGQTDSIRRAELAYYRKLLLQEITYLHAVAPTMPVCIVSIPPRPVDARRDMEEEYNRRAALRVVYDIQREVALGTGCVFWDLWALTKDHPEWISSDRIHFSDAGADMVGKMLYKSFITDYYRFVKAQEKAYDSRKP